MTTLTVTSLLSILLLAYMRGVGLVGGRIADSGGMLLWVWSLIALGIVAIVTVALSTHGLWRLRRLRQATPA